MREFASVKYGIFVPLPAIVSRPTSFEVSGKSLSTDDFWLDDQPAYWRVVATSAARSSVVAS